MNELLELLTSPNIPALFKFEDMYNFDFKESKLKTLLKEAMDKNWIENVYGDIYTLSGKYKKTIVSGCVLAQMIVPDSYISTYFVLSNNDWIPEAVYTITSIIDNKYFVINTNKYGCYSYDYLLYKLNNAGVYEVKNDCGKYYIAKPLRALCDLIYIRNEKIENIGFIYDKLRLDWSYLEELKEEDFNELQGKFNVEIVEYFLNDLKRRVFI